MSRERGKELGESLGSGLPLLPSKIALERDNLMVHFRSLLRTASSSPEKWVETVELIEPFLDYVRFRITGRLPHLETPERDTFLKQKLPHGLPAQAEDLPDLLNTQETARLLRVSPLTIKRWGKKGVLPPIRINDRGDRRFKREDVMGFLYSRTQT